ncbi:MAG TPA: hypothetical protein VN880_03855 [Solirubrobacteraceae bacterium]|nr:hypothetical protein [Solirubrobacteraceae bacterium]
MRKLVIAAVAGLVVAGGTTVALAASSPWPTVTVKPSVSPNKAGTPSHPQGVRLKAAINWQSLGAADQPIVTKFLLLFPKGAKYNGANVPSCTAKRINLGPQACPKASIMGSGTGTAYADTSKTHPKITVVNGGGSVVYFYTVLNNPARVQQPVIGHIARLHGAYSYSLSVKVPEDLQVVAGVPIELTTLSINAGKGSWLETTGCSGGKWPFQITTSYLNSNDNSTGSSTDASSLPCHK